MWYYYSLTNRLHLPVRSLQTRGFSIMDRYRRARQMNSINTNSDGSNHIFNNNTSDHFVPSSSSTSRADVENNKEFIDESRYSTNMKAQQYCHSFPQKESRFPKPKIDSSFFMREPIPLYAKVRTFNEGKIEQPEKPKFMKIALVGKPNAGKSSLLNAMLGHKIAAVSRKANTTDSLKVRGVKTRKNAQLCFLDAPGAVPYNGKEKCRELASLAWGATQESDVNLLVVDCVQRPTEELFELIGKLCENPGESGTIMESGIATPQNSDFATQRGRRSRIRSATRSNSEAIDSGEKTNINKNSKKPTILVLNKVDKQPDFHWVKARKAELEKYRPLLNSLEGKGPYGVFEKVFFTSALKEKGLDALQNYLFRMAMGDEESELDEFGEIVHSSNIHTSEKYDKPWRFPKYEITTLSPVEQVEELIKSVLFTWFNKDVPYRITQETVGWREEENISDDISCDDDVFDDRTSKQINGTNSEYKCHPDSFLRNKKIVIEHELIVQDSIVGRMVSGRKNVLLLNRFRPLNMYKIP